MNKPSLYEIQREIKNYFHGKSKQNLLSGKAYEELSIYKSLVYNAMEELLENIYPLCNKILGQDWRNIVLNYIENCPSNSPIFNESAREFPDFLDSDEFKTKYKYPEYLPELALYEWLELEIYNQDFKPNASVLLTPVYKICNFDYPITEIVTWLQNTETYQSQEFPLKPQQVLVYRNEDTLNVNFFLLSTTTAFVLEEIRQGNSFQQTLDNLLKTFNIDDSRKSGVEADLKNLLEQLKIKRIIL